MPVGHHTEMLLAVIANPPKIGLHFSVMGHFRKFGLAASIIFVVTQIYCAELAPGAIQFNRDVRPILSENCFPCHGADSAARKASLRLDRFEEAIAPRKDSQPAIVPGKPDGSALVHRITASDPDDIMPPPKTHKVLTAQQKDLLRRWIAEGAK